jgi:hypothetical protein
MARNGEWITWEMIVLAKIGSIQVSVKNLKLTVIYIRAEKYDAIACPKHIISCIVLRDVFSPKNIQVSIK